MKHVLIVSPHFPPSNTPDMQRIRTALSHLVSEDLKITILAVDASDVEAPEEEDLLQAVPSSVEVYRVQALSNLWTRFFGIRGIALRSFFALYKEGNKILSEKKIDSIYFSTTVFLTFVLGLIWKKKFNIPFLIDLQDPWVNTFYAEAGVKPPGGHMKFAFSQLLARYFEPKVVRASEHITVVSEHYQAMLQKRYPDLPDAKCTYLPFAAPVSDFAMLSKLQVKKRLTSLSAKKHIVYTGRVGVDMHSELESFFKSLEQVKNNYPHLLDGILLSFWGTSYAPKDVAQPSVMPFALRYNVAQYVYEQSTRIPYFESLQLLRDADILLLIGSDDERYNPSKIYPYLLAKKPIAFIKSNSSELSKNIEAQCSKTFFQLRDVATFKIFLESILNNHSKNILNNHTPLEYTDREMSQTLVELLYK